MKTRSVICLGLALTAASLAAVPAPASAQALLPPYEIITSVRSMGLDPISEPVRRGARYVLRAVDGRGVEVKVAADALNGRILFVQPVGSDGAPAYAERSYPRAYYPEGPRGNYQQQGNYERQPPLNPGEPSVIHAPRDSATAQPPARAPSAAKPPAPKVAAKSPARPAAPPAKQETPAQEQAAVDPATTGATPPSPPPETNPALAPPPVQGFD